MPTLSPRLGTLTDWTTAKRKAAAYYGASKLHLKVGTNYYSFVQYAFPADLPGATVSAATITGLAPGTVVQRHAKLASRVTYANMTGKTQPGTLAGSTAYTADGSGVVDLMADVQAVANGGAFYGYRLTKSGSVLTFGGWQASNSPKLNLTYAHKPVPPTGLSPSGEVVSLAAPPVQFTPDRNGLTQLRIQVDDLGGDWTSLLYDSGWKTPTSGSSLDLAADGWAGVSAGTSWQWRAQQRNALGDSDWSATATVTRVAKPTVTWVTVPTTTGDPTPLHEWSVTGGTQIRYALGLYDRTTGALLSGAQPWIPGATDGLTPSKGPTRDGQLVQSRLYIQDRDDRAKNIPSDPPWVLLTQDWTLSLAAATAPVTSLVVIQVDDTPKIRAMWEWPASTAGVPDNWNIGVGDDILTTIDGTTGRVGTTNSWVWESWELAPNTDLPLWVASVSDTGVAGQRVTQTVRAEVTGIHVVDPSTEDRVFVEGTDLNLAYTEASTTLALVDGSEATITTGMGGLSGDLSGFIRDRDFATAIEQRAAWLRIKGAGRLVRLAVDDRNIPVKLTAMSEGVWTDYATKDRRGYTVAAHVSQRGELPFDFAAGAPR